MTKMPEVYDRYENLRNQIMQNNQVIAYASPGAAKWLVDRGYEPKLRLGEAVKISRWGEKLDVTPVRWRRFPETDQWNWEELEPPYTRDINRNPLPENP